MKRFLCIWISLLCPLAHGLSCPSQAKDEAALVQAEQSWARALQQQDDSTLACILANEFEDADPMGALSDRQTVLLRTRTKPGSPHELSDLHAHVYGDFGYIRGVAVALGANGQPRMKIRFTDVYLYRDGRWQCVAAHESSFPQPKS